MEGSSLPQAKLADKPMPGASLPWPLHPACAIWPDLSPADLRDLADDIAANGLRDPITLTPANELLDGKNRASACIMAGVDPAATAVVHHGDPWLFSLSRNKHRRHLSTDQLALVLAALAKRSEGAPAGNRNAAKTTGPDGPVVSDDDRPTIAQLAEEGGISKTIVKSAKVVLEHGTEQEKDNVRAGRVKVRKTADAIRNRRRALPPPAAPRSKPEAAKPAADPIDDVVREIVAQCADGEWRSLAKIATMVRRAEDAVLKALKALGKLGVAERKNSEGKHEYWIAGKGDAALLSAIAAKDRRIAELGAELAEINAELDRATAPAKAAAPATVMAN